MGLTLRKVIALATVVAVNVPWVVVWYGAAAQPDRVFTYIAAVMMLLVIGAAVAVVLPCMLVPGLMVRRWLLISMLYFVNVYWPLRWVELQVDGQGYPGKQAGVPVYLALMLASSVVAMCVYWIVDRILITTRRAREIELTRKT